MGDEQEVFAEQHKQGSGELREVASLQSSQRHDDLFICS